jgi:hypothetical protein
MTAHRIIASVGGAGQPPEYGFQFFSVGLDEIIDILETEYLDFFIKNGGSSFKLIIGGYGTGKTHLLYTIREQAWDNSYATSLVTLTPQETPFHKLEAVYRAIVNNLQPPLKPDEILAGSEQGIENFIIRWFNRVIETQRRLGFEEDELNHVVEEWLNNNIKGFESTSFTQAIKQAFLALLYDNQDDFYNVLTWLKGESFQRRIHGEYGIVQKVSEETAFQRLRSLGQWIRQIGFNGLIVLFDEAEQTPSFSTRQMSIHLNNLRQLIDACQRTSFQGFMFFYAIPDEEFLNQRGQVYVALTQRLSTYFSFINPTGVKINLEQLYGDDPEKRRIHLNAVGEKLCDLYCIAYQINFPQAERHKTIKNVIDAAWEYRFFETGIMRLFVQKIVQAFHMMRKNGGTGLSKDQAGDLFE